MAYSGLEVTPHNGLEIQAQPDENKYYTGSSEANEHVLSQPETHPGSKQTSRKKASWALAVITVLCLAVALGVGLEKGLATKKIVSTSRYAFPSWRRDARLY